MTPALLVLTLCLGLWSLREVFGSCSCETLLCAHQPPACDSVCCLVQRTVFTASCCGWKQHDERCETPPWTADAGRRDEKAKERQHIRLSVGSLQTIPPPPLSLSCLTDCCSDQSELLLATQARPQRAAETLMKYFPPLELDPNAVSCSISFLSRSR